MGGRISLSCTSGTIVWSMVRMEGVRQGALQELEAEGYKALFSGFAAGSFELTKGEFQDTFNTFANALVPGWSSACVHS